MKKEKMLYYLTASEIGAVIAVLSFKVANSVRPSPAVGGEVFVFPIVMCIAYLLEKHKGGIKRYVHKIVKALKRNNRR